MILLDVPQSVERELKAQAVRLPSVSPETRFLKERQGYKKDYQQAVIADVDAKAAASVAPDNGRPRYSLEAQRGIVLTSDTIIERLKKLNSNLVFQRSIARPELIGIYLTSTKPEHQPEGLAFTGVSFNHGLNPEFAVVKKADDFVSPDGTVHIGECKGIVYPGWRTVLSRLIRYRYIGKTAAETLFGTCGSSEFWAKQLGHRA